MVSVEFQVPAILLLEEPPEPISLRRFLGPQLKNRNRIEIRTHARPSRSLDTTPTELQKYKQENKILTIFMT